MDEHKKMLCALQGSPEIWKQIRIEAQRLAAKEPFLQPTIHSRVLMHHGLEQALAQTLALALADANLTALQLEALILDVLEADSAIIESAIIDMKATVDRDPACHMLLEPFLFFKGFQALQAYRISHHLWNTDRGFAARIFQSANSRVFGVDIHPAAQLGHGIHIDHATGLVIGETAVVGNNVSIFHGVTLGGTGKESGDRHPKVDDGVLLSAHAQLLGNIRIGHGSKVGAGAVVLRDVAPHTTVAGVPAVRVGIPRCEEAALEMDADFVADRSED